MGKSKVKARNRAECAATLDRLGIQYTTNNYGIHLIVEGKDGLIDFWPGPVKFITRDGRRGRGLKALLDLCIDTEGDPFDDNLRQHWESL